MTHSQLELRKSQVEPLWIISSLDKNASRLALLYEMLPSFPKRHLWFWSNTLYWSQASRSPLVAPFMECFLCVSKQTSFLDPIFLLVASVKLFAKSPKAFALVFQQTVCISAWYSTSIIMRYPQLTARSDLLSQGNFLPVSAIYRGVFETKWHAFFFKLLSRQASLLTKRISKCSWRAFILWCLQSHFISSYIEERVWDPSCLI